MSTLPSLHDILCIPSVVGVVQGNKSHTLCPRALPAPLHAEGVPDFLHCAEELGHALGLPPLQQAQLHARPHNLTCVPHTDEWIGACSDSRAHLPAITTALHQFFAGVLADGPEKAI